MISVNGLEWVDQDGGRAIMEGVKLKSVTTGHDVYGRAHAWVINHEKRGKSCQGHSQAQGENC